MVLLNRMYKSSHDFDFPYVHMPLFSRKLFKLQFRVPAAELPLWYLATFILQITTVDVLFYSRIKLLQLSRKKIMVSFYLFGYNIFIYDV